MFLLGDLQGILRYLPFILKLYQVLLCGLHRLIAFLVVDNVLDGLILLLGFLLVEFLLRSHLPLLLELLKGEWFITHRLADCSILALKLFHLSLLLLQPFLLLLAANLEIAKQFL